MNKIIISLFIGLVFIGMLAEGYYQGLAWHQANLLLTKQKHQLIAMQQQIVQIPTKQQQLLQTQALWQTQQQALFSVTPQQLMIQAQSLGIFIIDWQAEPIIKKSGSTFLPITMTLEGTYSQLLNFLTNAPSQIEWQSSWQLTRQSPPTTTDQADKTNDLLLFNITALFYRS